MEGEKGSGKEEEEQELVRRVSDLLQRSKALQDAASNLGSRVRREEQALSHRALDLENELKTLRRDVFAAVEKDEIDHKIHEKLEEDLYRAQCMVSEGDVGALLPRKSHGFFLRMMLGPINVRASRNDVRFKVKEEYNAYRDRTSIMFMVFPSLLLILRNWVWNGCLPPLPFQMYQAWLLFFYTNLALRENVLRVNGSDIRPWWVYHHYCAMMMALVSLTWEFKGHLSCQRKQDAIRLFLGWAVMQGGGMLLQNRYQRQRLYTRIALGKAGRMDVVWGETAGVFGQLWLLYPVLFILQGFQGYLGIVLLRTAYAEDDPEWQMFACGLLLLVMAIGNFANTIETVVAKMRIKSRMKKGKQTSEKNAD